MIKKIFKWVFKKELLELQEQIQKSKDATVNYESQQKKIKNLLGNIEVSVDMHQYAPSWAVISIQGEKTDYIKFVDLGRRDIQQIQDFLSRFDRDMVKVDTPPSIAKFFKIPKH